MWDDDDEDDLFISAASLSNLPSSWMFMLVAGAFGFGIGSRRLGDFSRGRDRLEMRR